MSVMNGVHDEEREMAGADVTLTPRVKRGVTSDGMARNVQEAAESRGNWQEPVSPDRPDTCT